MNLKRLLKLLQDTPWEIIVNTHFLPAELIAALRRDQKLSTPQLTVTTDFETHRLWVNQPCDHYFAATDEGKAYLAHWGVPTRRHFGDGHTHLSGVSPSQGSRNVPRSAGARGTSAHRAASWPLGFGVGPVERIHQELLSVEQPLEIVVVAGRNAELKQGKSSAHCRCRSGTAAWCSGFTDQIDELMQPWPT